MTASENPLTRRIAAELRRVAALIDRHAGGEGEVPRRPAADAAAPLDRIVAAFRLSPFERDILLMCAGMELDADCAAAVTRAQDGGGPTFALALAALPAAHWSALLPTAPLRAWRLIECAPGPSLVGAALAIDERILHLLVGLNPIDERLRGIAAIASPTGELAESHRALADSIAAVLKADDPAVAVQVFGGEIATQRQVAAHAAAAAGAVLLLVAARDLPEAPEANERIRRLLNREAVLTETVVALVADSPPGADPAIDRRIAEFVDGAIGPVVMLGPDRRSGGARAVVTFELERPSIAEQAAGWRQALVGAGVADLPDIRALPLQFDMTAPAIRDAVLDALATPAPASLSDALWDSSRRVARQRMDGLVQRIVPSAGWDTLILPPREQELLRVMADQVRHRATVHGDWGFDAGAARGTGLAALFAGPSGTGKTLAAEVIAHDLRLDLYRIDLSAVVNKYIGETEKNLARVFDAAEAGGAILLFDEADALFGKRSEVKDSHDRHANIEVSYLLQRLESYRGLAILTSNLKDSIDPAFLRRLRFVVHFPFPDADLRARLWRTAFPAQAPLGDIDFAKLAQLNIAGGAIRTIALNAAFTAAAAGRAIAMADIRAAVLMDYAKGERTLTEAETRGWP